MSEQFITKRDEVKSLLRKLFRSEDVDLDFGIYRIMNYKRREIEQFIERDLIETAEAEFKQYARAGTADLEKELERLRAEVNRDFGTGTIDAEGRATRNHDAPKIQRYLRTQEEYRAAALTEEQVNDVFNHVYEFFSRYYYDGDFITRPKDSWQSKYSIPYKGEEVTLHWTTKNMYYIKTGEFFKKYSFKAGRYRANFVLVDAQVETGNAKGKKKFFILSEEEPVQIDETAREVDIKFNYRKLTDAEKAKYGTRNIQATIVSETLEKMRSLLEQSSIVGILRPRGGEEKSLMEKHLNAYVDRNTKDFFIHRNLKGFLERELDFYLKNEVWSLDELESSSESGARLLAAKAKAIRGISLKTIEFLSQIEEFQKKLFEKKKFVLKTDYCITLDLVPEELYEEIWRNEKQVEEWKELYKLDEITNGNFNSTKGKTTLTVNFLKQYKYLVIDTKFYSPEFKDKLLERFENVDDIINGLSIKSENFQALNLISKKYNKKVKCVYIDPPYNTGSDEFLYKDNYQHSSWLSMIENRLGKSKDLLSRDSAVFISIDYNEMPSLRHLMNVKFGLENFRNTILFRRGVKNVQAQFDTIESLNRGYEYILCYSKNSRTRFKNLFKELEESKPGSWNNHWRGTDRPTMRYELFGKIPESGQWRWSEERSKNAIENYCEILKHFKNNNISITKETIDDWYRENLIETGKERIDLLRYNEKNDTVEHYIPPRTTLMLNDVWFDVSPYGSRTLLSLFGEKVYDNPKPVPLIERLVRFITTKNDIIMDFFAGSGTTAHAVINLNMKDSGKRKYILVEMADYFDTVTLPRVKKVIFSKDWKNSIPLNNKGISHFFKYQYLEQYEDTLNNIEFRSSDGTIQKTLERFPDYFISYMLDYETRDSSTRLSIEQFKTPFNYKIKTLSGGEEREEPVDLVETFNYLLGLHIRRIHAYRDGDRVYRAVFGELDHEQVAVIWRDTSGLDLRRDKSFIEENFLADSTFNTIYVNGDSYVRNAKPIEPEFRRLMDA